MKLRDIIPLLVLIAIVVVLVIIAWQYIGTKNPGMNLGAAGTTTGEGGTLTLDQNISDGTIELAYPSKDFGLATNQSQVLVQAYIPPCDPAFNYCIYYAGSAYASTTFESAGLRIEKRADNARMTSCLSTPPSGFVGLIPESASSTEYAVSVFSPIRNAATGHAAEGSVYRLFYANTCYEFETRIGQSQYGNYPPGTIGHFTEEDATVLQADLEQMLQSLTLRSGTKVVFPRER